MAVLTGTSRLIVEGYPSGMDWGNLGPSVTCLEMQLFTEILRDLPVVTCRYRVVLPIWWDKRAPGSACMTMVV